MSQRGRGIKRGRDSFSLSRESERSLASQEQVMIPSIFSSRSSSLLMSFSLARSLSQNLWCCSVHRIVPGHFPYQHPYLSLARRSRRAHAGPALLGPTPIARDLLGLGSGVSGSQDSGFRTLQTPQKVVMNWLSVARRSYQHPQFSVARRSRRARARRSHSTPTRSPPPLDHSPFLRTYPYESRSVGPSLRF